MDKESPAPAPAHVSSDQQLAPDQTKRHQLDEQNKVHDKQMGSPAEEHRGGPLPNQKK